MRPSPETTIDLSPPRPRDGTAAPGAAAAPRAPLVDRLTFAACAAAALLPLWTAKYLPMVDLPQHAAQVSAWIHLEDPAWGLADQFELNWFSPYLLGYVLTRALAAIASVPVALKLVLSLYVVALPLSLRHLFARTGGERAWALLGFPLAFGAAFHWGLFNFLVALPAGIAFVAEAWAYAEAPTRRRGAWLALFGCALFFAHVLVLGASLAVAGGVLAARTRGLRTLALRAVPLVLPLAVAIAWLALTRSREEQVSQPILWQLELQRILELPQQLLGMPMGVPHPANREASWGALALLCAAAVTIGGVAREPRRFIPGLVAAALYGLLPRAVFGTFLVNERFAVLVVPFALVAFVPARAGRRLRAGRVLVAAAAVGWCLLLTQRFRAFDAEAAPFDAIVARIPPNRAVIGLMFDPLSAAAPGFPFLHFPAWYQAEKGGLLGFSFAAFFPELVRYRPGLSPRTTREELVWLPQTFDPRYDAAGFEYFIVRVEPDPRPALFPFDTVLPEVVAHEGTWWLFRRVPRSQ